MLSSRQQDLLNSGGAVLQGQQQDDMLPSRDLVGSF